MASRRRGLAPDPQGRFRPRIGWRFGKDGELIQPRFNLGSDRKEAERRYHHIQQLYDEQTAKNGWVVWAENAYQYAKELAAGEKTIQVLPNDDVPEVHYARLIDRQ